MAKKISELPALSDPIASDDLMVIQDTSTGITKSTTANAFFGSYSPDYTAVDHGVAGDGNTIKAAVDSIGSEQGTILLKHNSASSTTTYTLTTSETIPTNITLKFENGAIIDGAGTLTINGILETGDNQIFGSSITVAGLKTRYPELWGIDGTTDETEIQKAIDCYAGGAVILDVAGYTLTSAGLTLSVADMYFGCPDSRRCILATAADIDGLTISARVMTANVAIENSGSSTKAGYKFIDGGKNCEILNPWVSGFKYNYHFASSTGTGVAYNEFRHIYSVSTISGGSEIFMEISGAGWVNENHFFGGNGHASNGCLSATLVGNNNKLLGYSFENSTSDADFFGIEEGGSNLIDGCRFEMSCNGVRVNNTSANQTRMSRIINNFMDINDVEVALVAGRVKTDMFAGQSTFNGYITAGSTGSSTVDVESASAQAVASIGSTAGFNIGCTVVFDEGNANEEWGIINSVSSGVSITLAHNLTNTHAIGVTVTTEGRAHGVLGRPYGDAYRTQIWSYGYPVMDLSGETAGTPDIDILGGKLTALNGIVTKSLNTNTSNPPTDSQLDSAFGTPDAVGDGFVGVLDDNGAGANVYLVVSDGTNWWQLALTKAV